MTLSDWFHAHVGKNIMYERRKRKISRKQLAYKVGYHPTTIGRVERGTGRVHFDTVCRIADALNVTVDDLNPVKRDKHE